MMSLTGISSAFFSIGNYLQQLSFAKQNSFLTYFLGEVAMAAFEKILSGIPQMDEALDYIRLGDNVVFRVSTLDEFKLFLNPYVEQAKIDKRRIIYFRFASHEPLVQDCPEIKKCEIPLSHRFENFTVDIHNIIAEEGYDAFYIFDCLSELQAAWATDLMMGNFFKVTCPFLFTLDTVAYPTIKTSTLDQRRFGTGVMKRCCCPMSMTGTQGIFIRFWME